MGGTGGRGGARGGDAIVRFSDVAEVREDVSEEEMAIFKNRQHGSISFGAKY